MEVKMPRDILLYNEAIFFGLSLRQFLFSVLALGSAVGAYFLLNPRIGTEATSWVCMIATGPFAVLGFIKPHGVTAEKFAVAWVKSFLFPSVLVYRAENTYEALIIRDRIERSKPKKAPSKVFILLSRIFGSKPLTEAAEIEKRRRQRDKDFERYYSANIFKFRKKARYNH